MTEEQNDTGIMDANPMTLLTVAEKQSDMAQWDQQKRKDFTDLFEKRAAAAQVILGVTASTLLSIAHTRKFLGMSDYMRLKRRNAHGNFNYSSKATGRDACELGEIGRRRAQAILRELPPLRDAIRVLDKSLVRKLDRADAIKATADALLIRLAKLAEPVRMAQMDQEMTIGAFRQFVRDREDEMRKIQRELDDLGIEGSRLQTDVDAALVKGIPGINEAIISVYNEHVQRAEAMDQLTRRVVERVQFGDCKDAMTMLSTFEKDELEVTDHIKDTFRNALVVLKLKKPRLVKKASRKS